MARRPRIRITETIRTKVWERNQRGQSLWAIARSLDRHSSSIYSVLAPAGGIRPPERRRSTLALTLSEREEISRGVVANLSIRAMASELCRPPLNH